jgi:hypothetical protein
MADKVDILDKSGRKIEEETTFSEKLFFLERYYYKNKRKIFATIGTLALGLIVYIGYLIYMDYKAGVVNEAYYNYVRGIEADENLKIIEDTDPKLFSLIQFSNSLESGSKEELEKFSKNEDPIISDLATYQLISTSRDTKALNEYSYREGAIFKDLAIVSEAYALIEEGKTEEARNRLDFIEDSSSLIKIANLLKHYGVVGNGDSVEPTVQTPMNISLDGEFGDKMAPVPFAEEKSDDSRDPKYDASQDSFQNIEEEVK